MYEYLFSLLPALQMFKTVAFWNSHMVLGYVAICAKLEKKESESINIIHQPVFLYMTSAAAVLQPSFLHWFLRFYGKSFLQVVRVL